MNTQQEPKHFKIFRIIGFSLLSLGIVMLIIGLPKDNEGLIVSAIFTIFFSLPCLFIGFLIKIQKMGIAHEKYLLKEHKEDFKEISNDVADISSDAITTVFKSAKKGMKDSIFCKHCGQEIDTDSTFCKHCGKKQ